MKHLIIFLLILTSLGCGRKLIPGQHIDPIPVTIEKDIPVAISDTVRVPEKEYTGEHTLTQKDTSYAWDWGDATTEVVFSKNDTVPDFILVKTKVKEVKIPVTLRDTIRVVLRDTVYAECPPVVPPIAPPPAPGSPLSAWLFWGFGLLATILYVIFARKKTTNE